jgi:uncharacterized protein (TIGR02246 family)
MDRWVRVRHFGVPLVALAASCAPAQQAAEAGSMSPQPSEVVAAPAAISAEIRALLRAATQAWNRDDLDGYLAAYTEQATLSYISVDGKLSGKPALRARLSEAYFTSAGESDDLAFDEVDVVSLGPGHALVTGRWTTYQPGFDSQPLTGQGRFSMILQLEAEGWRITHEHSS